MQADQERQSNRKSDCSPSSYLADFMFAEPLRRFGAVLPGFPQGVLDRSRLATPDFPSWLDQVGQACHAPQRNDQKDGIVVDGFHAGRSSLLRRGKNDEIRIPAAQARFFGRQLARPPSTPIT